MSTDISDLIGLGSTPVDEPNEPTIDEVDEQNFTNSEPEVETPNIDAPVESVADSLDALDMLMQRAGSVYEVSKTISIFLYGTYGCGKTIASGTAGQICDENQMVLHYDLEDGAKSMRQFPKTAAKITTLPYKSMRQFDILLESLERGDPRLDKYIVFVVDSFSALQNKSLSTHTKMMAQSDSSRNPLMPQDGDYNLNTQVMKDYANRLKALDRHVIVTALSQEIEDKASGRILIRPELTPKLAGAMGGIWDLIGYLSAQTDADGKYTNFLQLVPTPTIAAKSRIGGLPPVIQNPRFKMLVDAYNKYGLDGATTTNNEGN